MIEFTLESSRTDGIAPTACASSWISASFAVLIEAFNRMAGITVFMWPRCRLAQQSVGREDGRPMRECRHRARLEVNGAVKFQGPVAVSDKIAESPIPVRSDVVILDVGSRMRVRQGNSSSAGIWLFQTAAMRTPHFSECTLII